MNILNSKNKRTLILKTLALCLLAMVSSMLASCDNDMDIRQSYPFTVEATPVPNKVSEGEAVETRYELRKEGDYANALYTARYFQFEGEGTLKMDNGITFLPSDRHLLENEKLRLHHMAQGDKAHDFVMVVGDSFGNSFKLEFDFNNRDVSGSDMAIGCDAVLPVDIYRPIANLWRGARL